MIFFSAYTCEPTKSTVAPKKINEIVAYLIQAVTLFIFFHLRSHDFDHCTRASHIAQAAVLQSLKLNLYTLIVLSYYHILKTPDCLQDCVTYNLALHIDKLADFRGLEDQIKGALLARSTNPSES